MIVNKRRSHFSPQNSDLLAAALRYRSLGQVGRSHFQFPQCDPLAN
ncbi:hypothetical protein [Anabaena lutea]|uniref:Uncharacterized protein n=1 Tax=Anabaena lutea FACHB-196 TaxID=2692881 RepID=A0ABR8FMB5_9NOST|nr:hypothetical protein [Anabaena lutea]MBD2569846.1 hypothetical protein [Anabaena lutea FACHB-196]